MSLMVAGRAALHSLQFWDRYSRVRAIMIASPRRSAGIGQRANGANPGEATKRWRIIPARRIWLARSKAWPVFRSLRAYRLQFLSHDLFAGLTLAAIAIPEQMATARLGGFTPQIGFFAFLAGSLAFAAFGSNRFLSCGADSTITPIFAGGLALLAASGSPDYLVLAAALALMVGLLLARRRDFPSRLDRRPALDSGDDRLSRRHLRAHPDFAIAGHSRAAGAAGPDAAAPGDAGRTSERDQPFTLVDRSRGFGDHHRIGTDRCADSRRIDRPCAGKRGRGAARA